MRPFSKSEYNSTKNLSIAFYNLENLFDTRDNPLTLDDDFTPDGKKKWIHKRYKAKIRKLGKVIALIGSKKSIMPPVLVGVVEVENKFVLDDLVHSENLRDYFYQYVHYDSPDERGIDVALLYQPKYYEYLSSETFPLYLEDQEGARDYTRDILMVKGNLNGELVYTIVNHWPSRRSGHDITATKRFSAAKLVHEIIDQINIETTNAKIIIMGDFNDDPDSESIKNHLVTEDFFNPMEQLKKKGIGTSTYFKKWHLFDQIIVSKNFLEKTNNKHRFTHAGIYNKYFLKEWNGKFKGSPFRTYVGRKYRGGFSDHFPVFINLKKQPKQLFKKALQSN